MVSVSGTVRRLFFFRARVVCVAGYSLVVRSRKAPGKTMANFYFNDNPGISQNNGDIDTG